MLDLRAHKILLVVVEVETDDSIGHPISRKIEFEKINEDLGSRGLRLFFEQEDASA